MANILTTAEAASVLRCTIDNEEMLRLLPQVDAYIKRATGRDWTADPVIAPEAKNAARMLLVLWFENPGMIASGIATLNHGLTAALVQLEAMALNYHTFEGLSGSGYISLPGVKRGDVVASVTGIIGLSGDQSASFETVISLDDHLKQVASDLSGKWFRAHIIPPGDL
ncbi:hypothetical protein BECAL_02941 [Bellilinea caldifistulae]|uniref:Phage gp6-like head-tail connector protein n=1 Tax=Bellilinea caldifistulae TaxID=360411 RepID=A0A0P6XGU8_9CHLR|nr:phage gp6-like head-tail connector protein [Bellilinea caldifistulae]KPL74539.1 hypothetical protein AC812_12140 [Bellilinea caldifistulae]GAP11748.1 hypothetical protein BECAL_02941 [Bellilinea caldifistulae]